MMFVQIKKSPVMMADLEQSRRKPPCCPLSSAWLTGTQDSDVTVSLVKLSHRARTNVGLLLSVEVLVCKGDLSLYVYVYICTWV